MKPVKILLAAAAVTTYIAFPAYRYYVIGSWIAYKIMTDRPRSYRIVAKGSKLLKEAKTS
ncbi:hypothetical protein ACFSL6_17600 [Paenibacillus thailandensis]|uniref:TMhelix containing protein n=1 Tax=Paenibacillus thailandensis TaxID=393250 RepID=A0ABW5R300_9BACL